MEIRPFADEAEKYWAQELFVVPIEPGTKKPFSRWKNYCYNMPNSKVRDHWRQNLGGHGIGLITGVGFGPGRVLGAFDVDMDDYIEPIRRILVKCPSAKRGRKGQTIFFVTDPDTKAMAISTKEGRVADVLLKLRQTVMPPTIHPEGMPYIWIGTPIYEVDPADLPYLSGDDLALIRDIIKNENHKDIMSGKSTHDPALSLIASLAGKYADEEKVCRFVEAFLPSDYSGDLREELPEMFRSARDKGLGGKIHVDYTPDDVGPLPMGYTANNAYVFLHQEKKLLTTLTPQMLLNLGSLLDLAPGDFWIDRYPKFNSSGKVTGTSGCLDTCWGQGRRGDKNNRGLIGLVTIGGRRILLAADASYSCIPDDFKRSLSALTIPHHGSKSLDRIPRPASGSRAIAVVCGGKKNTYGHPNEDVLEAHERQGWRIDATGRINGVLRRGDKDL